MTIKKRLKISNNLMITLPMMMTFIMGGLLFFFITDIAGFKSQPTRIHFENISKAQEAINTGEYSFFSDDIKMYQAENNRYIIVVSDDVPLILNETQRYTMLLVFVFLLLSVVYITNRKLTRYVFKSIITPIDTLVNGVHEIRDGNLEYRINYIPKDEFSTVCADFNEMAQRLSDMVSQQQKEENNRRVLIAGISHDLRTPLTSIKAYIEGLEKGVATSAAMQQKYLTIIKNKADDLEYIIKQLFLFSKLDIGDFPFRMEESDIGKELGHLISSNEKEYIEKGLLVSIHSIINHIYVEIDTVQFRNVVNNILENSVKYKINEHAEVTITCHNENGNVTIRFSDNGPGVPDEALEKMFDVFYRSDASRSDPSKGSGLGMAISKRIIERFGGKIKAENSIGGGLAIEIILPVSKSEVK